MKNLYIQDKILMKVDNIDNVINFHQYFMIVIIGEIANHEQFHLLPQFFLKSSAAKPWYVGMCFGKYPTYH